MHFSKLLVHFFPPGGGDQKRRTLRHFRRRLADGVADTYRRLRRGFQERRKEGGKERDELVERHQVLQLQVTVRPLQVLAQRTAARPPLHQEHK